MSGGVDSSVAGHLLREDGHEVVGVFMRQGEPAAGPQAADTCRVAPHAVNEPPRGGRGCCGAADAEDARRVADALDIPFYALDFQPQFARIVDYFVDEYARGRTPNPCIVCNRWLKFGKLFDYADSVHAEFVATGHYAQCLTHQDGTRWLCRGLDPEKDQSYALFGIDRRRLPRILLPVGAFEKTRIRALASRLDLPVAEKRDSQDVCFVAPGQHAQLVRHRRGDISTAGNLVTVDGNIVGRHDGIERFTVGQRKKLGVAMGEPYFVVRVDPATCDVTIGRREDLARQQLTADSTNWLAPPPEHGFRCLAQIRYNSLPVAAQARPLPGERLEVVFDEPTYGVAPGQAVVCYDGERVLGGGWIE